MSKDGPVKPRTSSYFHFLAGLSTGVLSATLLQPADLLKTRLQQSRSTTLIPTLRGILAGPNAFRRLWRGTLPSVVRTGFGSALYFSGLNALRNTIAVSNVAIVKAVSVTNGDTISSDFGGPSKVRGNGASSSNLPQLSRTANLATGAIARATAGMILMPVTVIKVRYESSMYAYKTILDAATDIYRRGGLRGFFVASGATAVRDAPYAGLYVVFYEECKILLSAMEQHTSLLVPEQIEEHAGTIQSSREAVSVMAASKSIPINFASGVLAAGMATAITNPFDAVKTRLQLMPGKYANMVSAGARMVKEEGWRSLMDGVGLRMGRKAASSALAWTVYEELVRKAERTIGEKI